MNVHDFIRDNIEPLIEQDQNLTRQVQQLLDRRKRLWKRVQAKVQRLAKSLATQEEAQTVCAVLFHAAPALKGAIRSGFRAAWKAELKTGPRSKTS